MQGALPSCGVTICSFFLSSGRGSYDHSSWPHAPSSSPDRVSLAQTAPREAVLGGLPVSLC